MDLFGGLARDLHALRLSASAEFLCVYAHENDYVCVGGCVIGGAHGIMDFHGFMQFSTSSLQDFMQL